MAFSISQLNLGKYLQERFSGPRLSEAFEKVTQGARYEVITSGANFMEARVKYRTNKTRKVTLRVPMQVGRLQPVMNCDCKRNNCRHQAMLLFMLIEDNSEDGEGPEMTSYKLDNKNPGLFRKFDYNSDELVEIIEYIHEYQGEDYYYLDYLGVFDNPDQLSIAFKDKKNKWGYTLENRTVTLKRTDDGMFIKCHNCREKTDQLCSHQIKILYAAYEQVVAVFDENWKSFYAHVQEDIVNRMNIPVHLIEKYFHIKMHSDGWSYQQISNKLLGKKWIDNANLKLARVKSQRILQSEQLAEQLKKGSALTTTYFWCKDDHWYGNENVNGLAFLTGKLLKTKEGLQKHSRTVITRPTTISKEQNELAQQLLTASNLTNDEERFLETQKLLLNHVEQFNELYHYVQPNFKNHRSVRLNEAELVTIHPGVLKIEMSAVSKDGITQLHRKGTIDDREFSFKNIIFVNEFFCADKTFIYIFENKAYELLMELFVDSDSNAIDMLIPVESAQLFLANLRTICDVKIETPALKTKEQLVTETKFQVVLREVGDFVTFEPRLSFNDETFNVFSPELNYYENGVFYTIDPRNRDTLLQFIKNAHPDFNTNHQVQEYVYLPLKEMMNNYWFLHFVEACAANDVELLGQKELSKFNYSKHRAKAYSHLKSGIDWFEVDMGVSFGKEKIKTADWIKALRNNESFVILKDGSMGMLPEEWLAQARKVIAVANIEKGDIKISKYRVNVVDDLFDELDDKEIIKELAEKKKKLENYDTNKKYKLPKTVKADLRPYQKHGFAWLKFLDESGFGGILADDMGLGKTVQMISLLADQKNKNSSMVIVPRSLLFNWAAELDKFCPSLTYIIHHGPNRGKEIKELTKRNLVISTYDTTAADIELFRDYRFNYIVLDESQAIKNPDSKRYKAMRLLQSDNKIAMTGTPIENNTFDLYAQLSFTSPGLLGTKTSFRNNFAIPIDNEGNQEAADLLRKLIHPFILRRTKEQVASDLPDKTETVLYCEMAPAQRKLYNKLKEQIKIDLEEEVEEKGLAKSKFKILDGLLRLRQMCNSPLLVNPAFTGTNADSVKIKVLIQNLTEELDQHNALVFSQFTSLLAIVRAELDKREIPYAYLDGSTRKRQEEVEKFMNNSELKIFLISLKAGNTGLNLTKADYVYILDPWWNPAVEAQAIDRTHRIGQDKQVFAYKLICKDSIEEKILELQEKKKNLAQDLIRTDENILKTLKKDELMSLFE